MSWRYSGQMAAAPAYAASTCSHSFSRRAIFATSTSRSTLVVEVVPAVATTAIGSLPVRRSAAIAAPSAATFIRNAASTGTFLRFSWPRPRVITALSIEEWACSLAYTVSGGRSTRPAIPRVRTSPSWTRWRAAAIASRLLIEAVSLMWPRNCGGSPIIWRSQSVTVSSSSVGAGPVFHSIALTLSPAASASPRMPGPEPVIAKYARKPGWFQWVTLGSMSRR